MGQREQMGGSKTPPHVITSALFLPTCPFPRQQLLDTRKGYLMLRKEVLSSDDGQPSPTIQGPIPRKRTQTHFMDLPQVVTETSNNGTHYSISVLFQILHREAIQHLSLNPKNSNLGIPDPKWKLFC